MRDIKREDIQIIARHSNWSKESIDKTLKENIYNKKESWQKFLKLFLISLGIGFSTSGVIFFFAYNWADLHKFVRIGMIEGLIVVLTLVVLFTKINLEIKNILLTGTSVLVGVLFAVFGQIYQTGANAYDFFLGWTVFIAIWVILSKYAPLWLLFIILINTTVILYAEQVAQNWSEIFICILLFLINSSFLISFIISNKFFNFKFPVWLLNLIALASVFNSTIGLIIGVSDQLNITFFILVAITSIFYGIGIKYGLKIKNLFYLSIIPFSVIVSITAFLIELSSNAGMFFLITFFIVASVTLVIKNLIDLQKKWIN